MPFTAKEIEDLKEDHRSLAGWIKELCWQVAKMNEQKPEQIASNPGPHLAEDRLGGLVNSAIDGVRQKRKYVRKEKIA